MRWSQQLARLPLEVGARVMPEGAPVVRDLVLAGIDRTFGAEPFDPDRHAGDAGLHGPGSASWKVLGEPAAIIGGVRGVLVQLLHPLAMAGVADHSAYERDLLGRLHRTSLWVAGTAFGPLDDVLAMARFVRRRHRPVRGAAPDGRPYRADDPRLLAWVSLALTESFLATDAAYAPDPGGGAAADAFVREQSRVAALLDPRVDLDAVAQDPDARARLRDGTLPLPMIEEGTLPVDLVGLRSAIARYEPELGVNHQGRAALTFLRRPAQLDGLPARVYPAVFGGALATIPAHRRHACGISISPRRERVLWAAGLAVSTTLRLSGGPLTSARRARARLERERSPRRPAAGDRRRGDVATAAATSGSEDCGRGERCGTGG
jgi:hypothetical protein